MPRGTGLLFGRVEQHGLRRHLMVIEMLPQGAFLDAVMAAGCRTRLRQDPAHGLQAPAALRAAAEAAISIDSRTGTTCRFAGKRAGEVLVCEHAAGADDHWFDHANDDTAVM